MGEGSEGWRALLPADARRAREVFERAVLAAPFCLELWEAFAGEAVDEAVRGGGGEGGGSGKGGDGVRHGGKVEDARRCVVVLLYRLRLDGRTERSLVIFSDEKSGYKCALASRPKLAATQERHYGALRGYCRRFATSPEPCRT